MKEGIRPRTGGREPIPERVRREVWRRDGGRCVDCGSRERLEFDHIIALANGGSNTARNIELRCEACNRKKAVSI
ncbi:MAG: HNH endonuclease [Actinobacteria bacterium]|nr:MAG: HNH endonuclease [Actinomycetota bacterium]